MISKDLEQDVSVLPLMERARALLTDFVYQGSPDLSQSGMRSMNHTMRTARSYTPALHAENGELGLVATTVIQPIITHPGFQKQPLSTASETYRWPSEDSMDIIDPEFHARKTEFSQYAEASARARNQMGVKAKETSKKAANARK